jgi:hypothetical protein
MEKVNSVTGFVAFQIHLVLALSSVLVGVRALARGDYETPGVSMIVFLLSLIGLSCNWREFIRVFSAIYGMEWWG